MRSPDGSSGPRFRVAVRRLEPPEGPFAVRFEVREGKGVLRLARAGVLIDPPARSSAEEAGITLGQLRSSRFLHLWDGGRARLAHSLARIDAVALSSLPLQEWVELEGLVEGGAAYLVLPSLVPVEEEVEVIADEPTSPQRMLDELRSQIEAAMAGEEGAGDEARTAPPRREPPPRKEPRAPRAEAPGETLAPLPRAPAVSAPPEPRRGPTIGSVGGTAGGGANAEEPTEVPVRALEAPELPPNLAQTSPSGRMVAPVSEPMEADEPVTAEVSRPTEDPPTGGVAVPAPPVCAPVLEEAAVQGPLGLDPTWPGVYLHARATTLVRFLRRRLVDDRLRIQELEAALKSSRRRGGGAA